MSYRTLKLLTILIPTILIGGFEYIRHDFLLDHLSMETGNLYMTILTFLLSYIFATWMFRKIHRMNKELAEEQARRAVYEERERLARDLHDHIAQMLFFLNVQLKQGRIDEARSAVSEIDRHLRQAIFNLRTLPEDGTSLTVRLEKWLREWSSISGIEADATIELQENYFSSAEEIQIFAVVQEAFTNIRKHSLASLATIEFIANNEYGWTLTIKDNGKGIDVEEISPYRWGVPMMRKRMQELGAEFKIQQPPTGGTHLIIARQGGHHANL